MGTVTADARWARQTVLPGFGRGAQKRLATASVAVVGAGGLGSAVLPVLVAAGVGEVVVVDFDTVEPSNLPRQTLHTEADVGRTKVDSALDRLRPLAADGVVVRGLHLEVDAATAVALARDADVLVDATDDAGLRYRLDDAAAEAGVPLVWGSALGWIGQVGVAWAIRGPRWRDLFPVPDDAAADTCAVAGVLPSLCTTVGGLMATEVLKVLTDAGRPLVGRLLVVDALRGSVREVAYGRADGESGAEESDAEESGAEDANSGTATAGAPAPGEDAHPTADVSVQQLAETLAGDHDVQLIDVREPWEAEIASIPGARLIPLGQLPDRLEEIDRGRPVLTVCHAGVRSARAADLLRSEGFRARSVAGGIDAWSRIVDPAVPRY